MCENETNERRCERDQNSLVWVPELENFCSIANMKRNSHHHHEDPKKTTPVNQVYPFKTSHSDLCRLPNPRTPSDQHQVQFCKKKKLINSNNNINNKLQATHLQKTKLNTTSMSTKSWTWRGNLLNLIIINTILSQLDEKFLNYITSPIIFELNNREARGLPRILFAGE